jgi:hypothetical protein
MRREEVVWVLKHCAVAGAGAYAIWMSWDSRSPVVRIVMHVVELESFWASVCLVKRPLSTQRWERGVWRKVGQALCHVARPHKPSSDLGRDKKVTARLNVVQEPPYAVLALPAAVPAVVAMRV